MVTDTGPAPAPAAAGDTPGPETGRRALEILAPAGDMDALRAAVGAGADAVYFGLDVGFNARARAQGFHEGNLQETFDFLHERGVKGFVTFNTVVYDRELSKAEACLRAIAKAGADAIIVQDLGIARFAHALAPSLRIHASTQMTVSSPEGAEIAKELGVVRVVLPRELSIEEIRRFKARTGLELECFIHGALCVSYSGQCLTSEAWGQRSANRGQCAQSCRLPYDLVVDGRTEATGIEKYLLSPKDLGAWDLLPDLVDAGVSCVKIEGRYKGPEYVAAAVRAYRTVRDAYCLEGKRVPLPEEQVEDLHLTYSRGFSPGWLAGDDHQALSHGLYPGHRGLRVGPIVRISGLRVYLRPEPGAPAVHPGSWLLFDHGDPESDIQAGVYAVEPLAPDGTLEVRFGEEADLARLAPGHVAWKSHDAAVKRRLLRAIDGPRRLPLDLLVRGDVGRPLEVAARDALGRSAVAASEQALEAAKGAPLSEAILREKLGALGDTPWELGALDVRLSGSVACSPAELKRVRRRLVAALLEGPPPPRASHAVTAVDPGTLAPLSGSAEAASTRDGRGGGPLGLAPGAKPVVIPLCRTREQVEAALALGAREVALDFMELVGLGEAARRVQAAGARLVLSTPRIQKPGEEPIDRRFEALRPDAILARHLGALEHFRRRAREDRTFTLHGDFSLNATNAITGRILLGLGLATLTPSYDLNVGQVEDLARGLPPERLEVTAHQHLPLYHTEYCLYAHHLSEGKDYRDCGRPCEEKRVALRDQKRLEHPVLVDVGCRNTVFHAQAQSAAPYVGRLVEQGVRRFRVELVWESGDEARRVLDAYTALVEGRRSAKEVAREVGALERYGVTSGTLVTLA